MKKIISLLLCLLLAAGLFSGCAEQDKSGKISVIATIFPEYDWVRQIAGEDNPKIELTLLLDSGADLHNYQPTVEDMVKISTCDLFIYVGGESDKWVEDVLSQASNKSMKTVNLLEALGDVVKEEELVEGMEAEEEEGEEEETEYDEHVWLSLRNAQVLCGAIADALSSVDPDSAGTYSANAAAYNEKLAALDEQYQAAVANGRVKTILFGDRFPFRYLADDYGLEYYAAFAGCSAETEASFATILTLANKVDQLGLGAILRIESSDGSIARTVMETTKSKDQVILTMDSMQSATSKDIENGTTYLSVMESNLTVLAEALS